MVGGWLRARQLATLLLVVVGLTAAVPARAIESTVSFTLGGGSTGDIRLVGDAFPGALVTFLKDGAVAGTVVANSASRFDQTFSALTPATYTFSIYAQDSEGRHTLTISFSAAAIASMTVTVSGILLSPILVVPDSIKRPEAVTESGLAKHNSTVTTFTRSDPITKQTTTNSSGQWSVRISDILHLGEHSVSALVNDGQGTQSEQASRNFQVKLSADLNIDGSVNLTDFSILMFSYGTNPPPNLASDINDNGNAPDLVDFSIMMFYWSR
jgi:hypothetical protein